MIWARSLATVALLASGMGVAAAAGAAEPLCFGLEATITGSGDIRGTRGPDVIVGSSGADEIDAAAGSDEVNGGDGDDQLRGGQGDDSITDELAGDADDTITGGGGTDSCVGPPGSGCESVTDPVATTVGTTRRSPPTPTADSVRIRALFRPSDDRGRTWSCRPLWPVGTAPRNARSPARRPGPSNSNGF